MQTVASGGSLAWFIVIILFLAVLYLWNEVSGLKKKNRELEVANRFLRVVAERDKCDKHFGRPRMVEDLWDRN